MIALLLTCVALLACAVAMFAALSALCDVPAQKSKLESWSDRSHPTERT
jgi:hypothetical protein